MKFQRGDQIIYIPNHADGPNHPDAETGFVTSVNEKFVFCRYWSKQYPGQLRTVANSEATPSENLIKSMTTFQTLVNDLLEKM
jgi:hypothetical protein